MRPVRRSPKAVTHAHTPIADARGRPRHYHEGVGEENLFPIDVVENPDWLVGGQ